MSGKNINLPLNTDEAQLVRDACMSYSIVLKNCGTDKGNELSRRVHEISRYLKEQILERREAGPKEVAVEFVLGVPIKGTFRKAAGGHSRGPKGTMISCDAVVYLPHATNTHAAPSARIDGQEYMVAFVDYGPTSAGSLRVGLSARN